MNVDLDGAPTARTLPSAESATAEPKAAVLKVSEGASGDAPSVHPAPPAPHEKRTTAPGPPVFEPGAPAAITVALADTETAVPSAFPGTPPVAVRVDASEHATAPVTGAGAHANVKTAPVELRREGAPAATTQAAERAPV